MKTEIYFNILIIKYFILIGLSLIYLFNLVFIKVIKLNLPMPYNYILFIQTFKLPRRRNVWVQTLLMNICDISLVLW